MSGDGWQKRASNAVSNALAVLAFPAVLIGAVIAGIGWLCWVFISLVAIFFGPWDDASRFGDTILYAAAWLGVSIAVIVVGRLVLRLLPLPSGGESRALAFAIITGISFLGLSLFFFG